MTCHLQACHSSQGASGGSFRTKDLSDTRYLATFFVSEYLWATLATLMSVYHWFDTSLKLLPLAHHVLEARVTVMFSVNRSTASTRDASGLEVSCRKMDLSLRSQDG